MNKILSKSRVVLDLLFPGRCPICDEVVAGGRSRICKTCQRTVSYVRSPVCYRCGKQLSDGMKEYCADCRENPHYFTAGRALYNYSSVAPAIYRFKYAGRCEYGEVFAREIAYYLGDYIRMISPDALIPVPMHKGKERIRGYNQAYIVAKHLGELMNIPVITDAVIRVEDTKPLKNMGPLERQNSLKKAFILGENGVKLSTTIVIDDVFTTGSTIDAISQVLLSEKSMKIYFITLAIGEGF